MAPRPIWRGHLRLALVSCPVALYNARHERGALRFNMLNPQTGNRIKMVAQDAETGEPISRGDTVKGYEFSKNRYVIMSDEDFDGIKVESSALMAVEKFVEASSIDPIYYDSSYYLAPDGKGSEDVYAVLREAIRKTGNVALARVVISQRERTVALRPTGDGLVAHTLNEERDINSAQGLFDGLERIQIDPEMVQLAVQLVERQTGKYDPADIEDRYEMRLRALIDAKVKGEATTEQIEPVHSESNVIDLMTALRKSIGEPTMAEEAAPKKTAKGARKAPTPEEARRQPGLKLPIAGGAKRTTQADAPTEQTGDTRRAGRKAS